MKQKTFVIVVIVFAVLVALAAGMHGGGHGMLADMFRTMHGH